MLSAVSRMAMPLLKTFGVSVLTGVAGWAGQKVAKMITGLEDTTLGKKVSRW